MKFMVFGHSCRIANRIRGFTGDIFLYILFAVITALRILSYMMKWRLPLRKLNRA